MQAFANQWVGTPLRSLGAFEPLTAPGDEPTLTRALSLDEQSLMLPWDVTLEPPVVQPEWTLCTGSHRLKPIANALSTPVVDLAFVGVSRLDMTFPITAVLKSAVLTNRGDANHGDIVISCDIMIVTTAPVMHPDDARAIHDGHAPFDVGEHSPGFPIVANETERFQFWYRKYAAGFKQNAVVNLPMVSRRALSWDTAAKEKLPVHVVLDGFNDLAKPLYESLGSWAPCVGAQFLRCPPEDDAHYELLYRIGKRFDIDLMSKFTPAVAIILNQFEYAYPKALADQARDFHLPILMRMVHVHYMCIIPVFGSVKISIVGYKDIAVPQGQLLIIPARLWIVPHKSDNGAGTTITVAF